MLLSDWLSQRQMTRTEFASRVGISTSYMTDLCAGRRFPGREIARRIALETNGDVTANDFVGSNEAA